MRKLLSPEEKKRRRSEYQHKWYLLNRDRILQERKVYNQKNRKLLTLKARRWREANPEKRHHIVLKSRLKNRYKINPELYFDLLQRQNGVCAICKKAESNSTGFHTSFLSVDHNHATGEIRGLLCKGCNLAIGNVKESPSRLIAAAKYLEERGYSEQS